ncbi:tRNA (guanosine(18)-2'-O)-methyltransferase, partial [Tanacetum coccineum]
FHLTPYRCLSRSYGAAVSVESVNDSFISTDDDDDDANDNEVVVEVIKPRLRRKLLRRNPNDDVTTFMKMERRTEAEASSRWFPYLDRFKAGSEFLSSEEVLDAVDSSLMDLRKDRFRNVVENRTYSVCLVVEGLSDAGNVSAVFRSADALGFQSVHVVSLDSNKRYREHRHVSMGAEKWLDIELWDSTEKCFEVLKSRGYRIATTHLGMETVSIHDMDWSCPTAIVVGNEGTGISEEALRLSDMHCSIPMKGMVDSFNVSVASGILMHHAVRDRTSRLGAHGDLTSKEKQILLAEFSLRHSRSSISIAQEYAKRKVSLPSGVELKDLSCFAFSDHHHAASFVVTSQILQFSALVLCPESTYQLYSSGMPTRIAKAIMEKIIKRSYIILGSSPRTFAVIPEANTDPFNRSHLTTDMLIPDKELKQKIEEFVRSQQRGQHGDDLSMQSNSKSSILSPDGTRPLID